MGKFYKEFGLKKVLECGAAEFWEKIKVGDIVQLTLNLEEYNQTDLKKQVGALFEFKEKKEVNGAEVVNDVKAVIGVIPEEEGKLIKDFLDMGWNKLFKAVISQNDNTKPLENRFKVAVYIERFIDVKDDVKKQIEEIEKNKPKSVIRNVIINISNDRH